LWKNKKTAPRMPSTRVDYDPRLWGGAGWTFLEYCAKGLDGESSRSFGRFVELLPDLLPCEDCRRHTAEYLKMRPLDANDPLGWVRTFRASVAARITREHGIANDSLTICAVVALAAAAVAALAFLRAARQ
jgi:hypothetical protein